MIVIDAELFAPATMAIEPGDPNNRTPCETLNATVSKPPAANVGSVKVMASLLADEKVNALFSMTGSLAGAVTVGGLLAVLVTVREVLADADNPLLIFVILTVSESAPTKFEVGV